MLCKRCRREFEGETWKTLCLDCYKRVKALERQRAHERAVEEGAVVCARIDARKREARRAWRKLKGPGEGQTGEDI